MKALFIDVEKQKINEFNLEGDYQKIVEKIGNGCTIFACPIQYENRDLMCVDDESLLHPDNIKGGFIYDGWSYPIVSNAVIVGQDDYEGDREDVKSTVNDMLKGLHWLSEKQAKNYANNPAPKYFFYF